MTPRPVRRCLALGAVAIVALALASCSSADEVVVRSTSAAPTTSAPPTPTPTPTPEIVIWAGGVCVARDNFVSVIAGLASHLTYDPNSDADVGQQFQAQLQDHMDEVQVAAEQLGAAMGKVPLDYAKAGEAFVDVQGKVDRLTAAKDQTMTHLTAAQEAGNVVAAGAELFQAASSAKDTYDAGQETLTALKAATGATDGDMGEAFAKAPECQ